MDANPSEASAAPAAPPKPAKVKGNPLTDLIDSEKEYVDRLAGVIRKVAAAWSRANFPPAELDAMFRAIEAVYRANRGFVSKLKEIGPNPASPKALGDLLMRWTLAIHVAEQTRTVRPLIGFCHTDSMTFDGVPRHPDLVAAGFAATIEDLDAPYTRYCNTYSVGFDSWEPIASNAALPPLLAGLSESHPPTAATSTPVDGSIPTSWTLDGLFALPRIRVKYYKKLYSRLLKSTQPGRSDHKLLVGATERLDGLLAIAMSKLSVFVGEPEQGNETAEPQGPSTMEAPLPPPPMAEDEREPIRPLPPVPQPEQPPNMENEPERRSLTNSINQEANGRVASSVSGSSRSDRFSGREPDNDRLSLETAPTSVSAGRSPSAMSNGRPSPARGSGPSSAPFSAPSSPPLPPTRSLFALQDALDTTRVLDIFSMKPKPCKLQLAQPINPLPFDRIIKFEADVIISFTPKATGEEVVYERAHIVMLTDLFLVCEWVVEEGQDSPTLFLCFPPLAARHLKVVDEPVDLGDSSQTSFQVHVMRKETLIIRALSSEGKQRLARDFSRAVQEAINVAPPPRPPNGPPQSGPPSAAQSPIGSPTMGRGIPPIMLPENDLGSDGPGIGPRSPSTHSFVETTGNSSTMLSPRNSESGVVNQFSRMGLGGGSETNLPLSNELPPGPGFGPQSRSPSFGNGPMPHPPPSPGFGPGGPPGPGGMPRGPPGPPFPGPFPPGRPGLPGPPGMGPPGPGMGHPPHGAPDLHKSPSGRSLGPGWRPEDGPVPPLPGMPRQNFPPPGPYGPGPGGRPPFPPHMPPQGFPFGGPPGHMPPRSRSQPPPDGPDDFDSPPTSPVESNPIAITGPTVISAQMKCKVFLKQQHAQWKSLGAAKLKLFKQEIPVLVKQLVVEADTKSKEIVISTIVLTDGVERVGRTGIAIELSDKGVRTGIVYMLQLRNEAAATGLFNDLLAGSDRRGGGH